MPPDADKLDRYLKLWVSIYENRSILPNRAVSGSYQLHILTKEHFLFIL